MVGERIVGARRAGAAGVDHDAVERVEHRPLSLVERGHVETHRAGRGDGRAAADPPSAASVVVGDRPMTDRRHDSRAGQQLELVDVDPPALADHPLDGAVGSGLRCRSHRRDVEHLAAPDGLVAARLAQHVAIAGQQRQLDGQVEPDGAARAGRQRVRSDHAHLDGDLA